MAELWLRQDGMNSTERVKDDNPLPTKPTEVAPGPASLDTSQVAMSSTLTLIAPSRDKARALTVLNSGAGTLYLCGAEAKSSTTGFPLVSGASKTLTTRSAVFGICAAGVTSTAAYTDEFDV